MAATLPSPSSVVIAKPKETASVLQSEEIQDLRRLLRGSVDQNKMLVEEAKQLREDLEEKEFCVGAGDCKIRSVAFATLLQRMTGLWRRLTIEQSFPMAHPDLPSQNKEIRFVVESRQIPATQLQYDCTVPSTL